MVFTLVDFYNYKEQASHHQMTEESIVKHRYIQSLIKPHQQSLFFFPCCVHNQMSDNIYINKYKDDDSNMNEKYVKRKNKD